MSQTKTLNIVPDDSLKRIHLSQGDLGRTLIFKLFEGSASYSPPTGASVKIVGTKPSGVGYSVNGTFSENTVTIVTTSAMTDEHGALESELIVTNQAETEIFKSANFLLMIEKDPHPAGTVDGESSVVVPTLLQLQSAIGDLTQLNTSDKTSLVGAINEAMTTGGSSGLTNDIKEALLDCFEHVAWIDENGQDYYDALHDALYPPANLTSISCVYTQSGTVYDTDTLDSLKTDLVVTAHYDDSSTQTVTTYTLSGTLTEGTSTITVTYGGKTTTFTVTVTHMAVIDYTANALSDVTWYDDMGYNGTTGELITKSDQYTTSKFTIQDCLYLCQDLQHTFSWISIYVWDSNDNYLGFFESSASFDSLYALPILKTSPNNKYSVSVYSTSTITDYTTTMMPVDHRANAVNEFSIDLTDYLETMSDKGVKGQGYVAEIEISSVLTSAGMQVATYTDYINQITANVPITMTISTGTSAHIVQNGANSFKISDCLKVTMNKYQSEVYMQFSKNGITTFADLKQYISDNNVTITFNG